MKVILLNSCDEFGGAARAAVRLHNGLRKSGVESHMLVQRKKTREESIIGPANIMEKVLCSLRPTLDKLPLMLYDKMGSTNFHPAWFPDRIARKIEHFHPDIIHLHWVCDGFLRIESLKRFQLPIVWTLHDMWPFSGGCHYDADCGNYTVSCGGCPSLKSTRELDLSRWVWKRKFKVWQDLNLSIVSPSRWLADCAKQSSLFKDRCIETIPNGIDLKCFRPVEKKYARKMWGLAPNKNLILFGAMSSTSDKRKGFHLLQSSLQKLGQSRLRENTEVVVFGAEKPVVPPDFSLKTRYLGSIRGDHLLALLYGAADVFLLPSIQENLSNMAIEALACGTPCVAFDIGGMPDMIGHKKNGYLAQPYDSEDFGYGIFWVLKKNTRLMKLSKAARKKTEKDFSVEIMASRYKRLYTEITKRSWRTEPCKDR